MGLQRGCGLFFQFTQPIGSMVLGRARDVIHNIDSLDGPFRIVGLADTSLRIDASQLSTREIISANDWARTKAVEMLSRMVVYRREPAE